MTQIAIDGSIINFVTVNQINMYAIYNAQITTLGRVIDTFYSNYSFRNKNHNVRIFSDSLDRYITDTDMNRPMSEFKFNKLTKFYLNVAGCANYVENSIEKLKKIHDKLPSSAYTIFCKTLTGKTLEIDICSDLTVYELKLLVYELEKIPIDQQRLIAYGRQLEDSHTMADYWITKDTIVHLVLRLRGGMYDETSGKNGNYKPLKEILFTVSPDLKKIDTKTT